MPSTTATFNLSNWLRVLETFGVDLHAAFPTVMFALDRASRVSEIASKARSSATDPIRYFATADLDNEAAILGYVSHIALSKNPDHMDSIDKTFELVAENLESVAYSKFRKHDLLAVIRPHFDAVAARLVAAAETIPYGVMSIGDAARLGHGDMYAQAEKDAADWQSVASLLTELIQNRIVDIDEKYYALEAMVEDIEAYRGERARLVTPLRIARAVASGRPNLRIPTEPHIEHISTDGRMLDTQHWDALDATDAEKAARADLGL